jgi:hypothetical protein
VKNVERTRDRGDRVVKAGYAGKGKAPGQQLSELQIGPLALVLVTPFTLLLHGAVGKGLALLVMSLLGLVILDQIGRLAPATAQGRGS